MYGIINHGIERFVTEKFGATGWRDVCLRAGITDTKFEGMLTYPDDVTYTLIGTICEKYNFAPADALETFGNYFFGYSQTTIVGKLLRFGGEEFADILYSLNAMHARIKLSMPHLRPPHFEFEENPDGSYQLHYSSAREGLEHLVIGLVRALAEQTKTQIDIQQDPEPAYPGIRASFTLRII